MAVLLVQVVVVEVQSHKRLARKLLYHTVHWFGPSICKTVSTIAGVRFKSDPIGILPNSPINRFRYQNLMCIRIQPVYGIGRLVPGIDRILPVLI